MKSFILFTVFLLLNANLLLHAQAPTVPTKSLKFSNLTGNSVKIDMEAGNGERRVLFVRKEFTVDAIPTDSKIYTPKNDFGTGSALGGYNYAVYSGAGQSVTINNLEPNIVYHFACFEFNGSQLPVYSQISAVTNVQMKASPTVPTQDVVFTDLEANRLKISISRGNGNRRLVILKKGTQPFAVPENGKVYKGNAEFRSGFEIAPDEFVVIDTDATSATITNLEPGTLYYFRVYEYDIDLNNRTYYLKDQSFSGSVSTEGKPAHNSTVIISDFTGASATLLFTNRSGKNRMVVMRQGAPVISKPVDLMRYTGGSKVFGSGPQLGPGDYIITSAMNGDDISITNLKAGLTYYAEIFEFNGYYVPIYLTPGAVQKIEIPVEPNRIATALRVQQVEGNSLRAGWTNGNGARRLVIARKNEPVTVRPTDGHTYVANPVFEQGTQLAEGQFVVYDGVDAGFNLKGLEAISIYHLAVFEYNTPDDKPNYLTSSYLSGIVSTIPYPTNQTSGIVAKTIEAESATIAFGRGNGERRMFVMREEDVQAVDPPDFKRIDPNNNYGAVEAGPGNFVVFSSSTGNEFNVTNLRPGTRYHVNAYEFNGLQFPAYLKPAATYSFVTSGSVTLPPSEPVFSEKDGNRVRFSWKNGTGEGRIVIARKDAEVNFIPANGVQYASDTRFGKGEDLGDGQFVVYKGTGNTIQITELLHSTNYHFAVYEYAGNGTGVIYHIHTPLKTNGSTAYPPELGSKNMTVIPMTNSAKLSWTAGTGSGRLVILKEGSPITSIPVNLTKYTGNPKFKIGAQIGPGEYLVYSGNASQVNLTGLESDKDYHYSIFEFNGSEAPVYNALTSLTGVIRTTGPLPVTWLYFKAEKSPEGNVLEWATLEEFDSDYFVVERSHDPASGFQSADIVRSAGSSNSFLKYSYTDFRNNRPTYYRLKQVDRSGRFSYSRIVNVVGENAEFVLYPNPVTDKLYVQHQYTTGPVKLTIYNFQGILIRAETMADNTPVDVTNLPRGTYLVVIQSGNERLAKRIVKK